MSVRRAPRPETGRLARAAMIIAVLVATPVVAEGAGAATSPQEAALAYLQSCRDGDYAVAARYLDLDRVPESRRASEGPRLARQLKVVLDRKLWIDVDALSTEPAGRADDGLPAGVDGMGTIETAQGDLPILLSRSDDPQIGWRISRSTVARIPGLYAEFGYGRLGEWLPAPFFTIRLLEIELWQWAALLLLVPLAWGLGTVVTFALVRAARRLVPRAAGPLAADALWRVSSPMMMVVAVAAFYAGALLLGLSVPAERFLGHLTKAFVILAVTWLSLRIVDGVASTLEERVIARGDAGARTAIHVGGRIAKGFLVIVAALSALQNLGFNITGLIAGLGVGGIAVALAAQRTFENFFGGMSILADRPVEVGHFCRFGDKIGTIEEIGLRSTRVRTLDRTLVTVPNAEFSSLQLENFAARDRILFLTTLGLRYETTADQLRWLLVKLRELLLAHPKVGRDPARVRFVGFGAFSLDLEIYAYVLTSDWNEFLAIREDLLLRIIDVVEESGSGFAFPSQTVYVGHDDGLDAERSRGAEDHVRGWRASGELCLPDFPPERIAKLDDTLAYPPEGSAVAR